MFLIPPKSRFCSAVGNGLFNSASLDLRFAQTKSLVDATTGQNLVTFTRASSSTYVDSQGVIRNAVTNLLLQSEDFSTTWTNVNSTELTNVIASPTGAITADRIVEASGSVTPSLNQAPTVVAGSTYTFSCYAKEDPTSAKRYFMLMFPSANFGANVRCIVDLATGAISSVGSPIAISSTSVGNGWFRVSVTATATVSGTPAVLARITNDAGGSLAAYTGDGASGIYIWGAQLEQSSTVGEYIPTTSTINSAPRFDHNPTTGESLGLLVEESRTNLLLLSGNLYETGTGAGSWVYQSGTMSDNTQVAPDGTTTADTLTTTGGALSIYQSATVTASTTYTGSAYVRLGTMQASDFKVAVYNNSTPGFIAVDVAPSQTPTSSGWTRISYSFTTPAGCTSVRWYPFRNSAGLGSCTVHLWGAQLEAGAFPTSYIPTTTAAATRSADVASISGSNFSSWYRQDEGTVFVERIQAPTDAANARRFVNISDGTSSNAIQLYQPGGGQFAVVSYASGVSDFAPTAAGFPASGAVTKGSFAFSSTGKSASRDGGAIATSAVSPPVSGLNTLFIGGQNASNLMTCSPIRRLTYWPQRLNNSILQSITQ